jgi:hypothetical protein
MKNKSNKATKAQTLKYEELSPSEFLRIHRQEMAKLRLAEKTPIKIN